jgi:hypothetical protein
LAYTTLAVWLAALALSLSFTYTFLNNYRGIIMKQTIGLHEFRNAFHAYGRDNHFSYEGLEVLFNSLEDLDENMELDVIALCCDFSEYDLKELLNAYDITDEVLTDDNESELLAIATDYLSDNTWLCGVTEQNTFVFQQF